MNGRLSSSSTGWGALRTTRPFDFSVSVASVHSYRMVSTVKRNALWLFRNVMAWKGRLVASYGFLLSNVSCSASLAGSNSNRLVPPVGDGTNSMKRLPLRSFQL